MLNEQTLERLRQLNLDGMAKTWLEQQSTATSSSLGFDERFGLLVDAENLHRENKRMKRLLMSAKLKCPQACLEDVEYASTRNLDKATLRQFSNCTWVKQAQVIIITGATGTGKTFLACALANQACRKGFSALYRRSSRFFDELALARVDGSYPRLLAKLARVDVLILDDWGMAPVREPERRDLLEVIDDRHGNRATLVTSQMPPEKWHDLIGDPTSADAICDRLLNKAHRIDLKGKSRRSNGPA